jgi:hypothetical protein
MSGRLQFLCGDVLLTSKSRAVHGVATLSEKRSALAGQIHGTLFPG